jgi:hypothetical protein
MSEHRNAILVAVITGLFGIAAAVVAVVLPMWLEDEEPERRNPTATPTAIVAAATATATTTATTTGLVFGLQPTPDTTSVAAGPTFPSGTTLYQADSESGWSGWNAAGWHRGRYLSNDGLSTGMWIEAPHALGTQTDYAVEAEIQVVRRFEDCQTEVTGTQYYDEGHNYSYGFVARAVATGSYGVGARDVMCRQRATINAFGVEITSKPVDENPAFNDTAWHTYRVEVDGAFIRFLVDDELVIQTTDTQFGKGGKVGMWCWGVEINVRRFTIEAL